MNKVNNQKGFSILEVILSITLLAIMMGFSLLYYENSQIRADVHTQANILVSSLRLASSNALSGNNSSHNAIHLESNSYTTFIGTNYDPNALSNSITVFPSSITISDIALNEGGADIIFNSPDGKTNNFGSFNLNATAINKTININVSQLGTINY